MTDLEFLTGICQSVLNPLPSKEEDEYIDPWEDDSDPYPEREDGYWERIRYDSDGNPVMRFHKWGF